METTSALDEGLLVTAVGPYALVPLLMGVTALQEHLAPRQGVGVALVIGGGALGLTS
jgi:drug/metabolite transporter (DMT)-like permease